MWSGDRAGLGVKGAERPQNCLCVLGGLLNGRVNKLFFFSNAYICSY